MKRLFLISLLALMTFPVFAQNDHSLELDIRVATCNVRYPTSSDGDNIWENRRERLVKALQYLEADVIGHPETVIESTSSHPFGIC